jgi:hypothetical protein
LAKKQTHAQKLLFLSFALFGPSTLVMTQDSLLKYVEDKQLVVLFDFLFQTIATEMPADLVAHLVRDCNELSGHWPPPFEGNSSDPPGTMNHLDTYATDSNARRSADMGSPGQDVLLSDAESSFFSEGEDGPRYGTNSSSTNYVAHFGFRETRCGSVTSMSSQPELAHLPEPTHVPANKGGSLMPDTRNLPPPSTSIPRTSSIPAFTDSSPASGTSEHFTLPFSHAPGQHATTPDGYLLHRNPSTSPASFPHPYPFKAGGENWLNNTLMTTEGDDDVIDWLQATVLSTMKSPQFRKPSFAPSSSDLHGHMMSLSLSRPAPAPLRLENIEEAKECPEHGEISGIFSDSEDTDSYDTNSDSDESDIFTDPNHPGSKSDLRITDNSASSTALEVPTLGEVRAISSTNSLSSSRKSAMRALQVASSCLFFKRFPQKYFDVMFAALEFYTFRPDEPIVKFGEEGERCNA